MELPHPAEECRPPGISHVHQLAAPTLLLSVFMEIPSRGWLGHCPLVGHSFSSPSPVPIARGGAEVQLLTWLAPLATSPHPETRVPPSHLIN